MPKGGKALRARRRRTNGEPLTDMGGNPDLWLVGNNGYSTMLKVVEPEPTGIDLTILSRWADKVRCDVQVFEHPPKSHD